MSIYDVLYIVYIYIYTIYYLYTCYTCLIYYYVYIAYSQMQPPIAIILDGQARPARHTSARVKGAFVCVGNYYIYIYIQREREKEREIDRYRYRQIDRQIDREMSLSLSLYIYIYIHIGTHVYNECVYVCVYIYIYIYTCIERAVLETSRCYLNSFHQLNTGGAVAARKPRTETITSRWMMPQIKTNMIKQQTSRKLPERLHTIMM